MEQQTLSALELEALGWLKSQGGSVLITAVPEKSVRGIYGMEPGLTIFKKLAKKGLVLFTEDDPMQLDDGTWIDLTPSIDLIDRNIQI